ncbi:MAG: hypothetical protein ACTSWN_12655 [Promethearchaeota archaeon]
MMIYFKIQMDACILRWHTKDPSSMSIKLQPLNHDAFSFRVVLKIRSDSRAPANLLSFGLCQ